MGLRINTNVASLTAQRNLFSTTNRLQGNFSRLSSGLRIASAADDAAGLGISERQRSQVRSLTVASRNTQDGISLAQTAEGALNEVSNLLGRARELAVQASNGTLSQDDRDTIDTEVGAILGEIDRIASTTNFNGVNLLDGSTAAVDIQVGINDSANDRISVALVDTDTTALTINAITTDSAANAQAALTAIDGAVNSVNTARGELGASQNLLSSSLASTLNLRENLSASESRIRDVDVAEETADLTRNSILQQAATSVLAQANAQPQIALSLLG